MELHDNTSCRLLIGQQPLRASNGQIDRKINLDNGMGWSIISRSTADWAFDGLRMANNALEALKINQPAFAMYLMIGTPH
jgi:hypothetical protein